MYHTDIITKPLQHYCDTIVGNIYSCLEEKIKNMVGPSARMGTNFCMETREKFTILSKFTYFAEMHGKQQHIHPNAIVLSFCV